MDKKSIENFFEEIENDRKERTIMEKQVQSIDSKIQINLEKYRIESVKRVLNYINDKCWKNQKTESLQKLIVHCLNKLNGNIDGIELSLEED